MPHEYDGGWEGIHLPPLWVGGNGLGSRLPGNTFVPGEEGVRMTPPGFLGMLSKAFHFLRNPSCWAICC